jgi:hypothetical protein
MTQALIMLNQEVTITLFFLFYFFFFFAKSTNISFLPCSPRHERVPGVLFGQQQQVSEDGQGGTWARGQALGAVRGFTPRPHQQEEKGEEEEGGGEGCEVQTSPAHDVLGGRFGGLVGLHSQGDSCLCLGEVFNAVSST